MYTVIITRLAQMKEIVLLRRDFRIGKFWLRKRG